MTASASTHLIGTMHDAAGRGLAVGVQADEVKITAPAGVITLAPRGTEGIPRTLWEAA